MPNVHALALRRSPEGSSQLSIALVLAGVGIAAIGISIPVCRYEATISDGFRPVSETQTVHLAGFATSKLTLSPHGGQTQQPIPREFRADHTPRSAFPEPVPAARKGSSGTTSSASRIMEQRASSTSGAAPNHAIVRSPDQGSERQSVKSQALMHPESPLRTTGPLLPQVSSNKYSSINFEDPLASSTFDPSIADAQTNARFDREHDGEDGLALTLNKGDQYSAMGLIHEKEEPSLDLPDASSSRAPLLAPLPVMPNALETVPRHDAEGMRPDHAPSRPIEGIHPARQHPPTTSRVSTRPPAQAEPGSSLFGDHLEDLSEAERVAIAAFDSNAASGLLGERAASNTIQTASNDDVADDLQLPHGNIKTPEKTSRGIEFAVQTLVNGTPSGTLPLLVAGADAEHPEIVKNEISVRLGDVLGLFRYKMDPGIYQDLSSSKTVDQYLTLNELRAAGIGVSFDKNDRLVFQTS